MIPSFGTQTEIECTSSIHWWDEAQEFYIIAHGNLQKY